MLDTSGLVVMGVGFVSVVVVNFFVTKNNWNGPKNPMSLQAYSEPDEFPLPIPHSIYGSLMDSVNDKPKVEKQSDIPEKEETLKGTTSDEQKRTNKILRSKTETILQEPAMNVVRPMSNPFLQKLDLRCTLSQSSMSFHDTSKLENMGSPLEKTPQGDQTVKVPADPTTDDLSTASQGDSVSKDFPKDLSSYSSSLSWEDAFVEREPFIEPVQGRQKQSCHFKK